MAHAKNIQEKLEREFNMTVITVPNVSIMPTQKKSRYHNVVNNPSDNMTSKIDRLRACQTSIVTKSDFVGQ